MLQGSRKLPQFALRLPFELRDYIWEQAEKNRRSINGEITVRLEESMRREKEAANAQTS